MYLAAILFVSGQAQKSDCLFLAGLKRVHGFSIGDSAEAWKRNKWEDFESHLQKVSCVLLGI